MMRAAECGPMPSMVVQELADLVGVEQALDVALDLGQAAAPEVEVLAEVAGLQRVDRAVMLADRALGRRRRAARPARGRPGGGRRSAAWRGAAGWRGRRPARSGIRRGGGGEHAVEAADVAGELGEAEVDQAVQLAHPVVEVLAQPVAVADELAQGSRRPRRAAGWARGASRRRGGRGPSASMASVLVRSRLASWKRRAVKRVDERHVVPGRGQHGEEVLPVVPGRLHDDRAPAAARAPRAAWRSPRWSSVIGDGPADRRAVASRRASTWRSDAMSMPANMVPPSQLGAGSLGAGVHAHACPSEDASGQGLASGYRSSPERRSRAPISCTRTKPQARCGDPLPATDAPP